MPPVQGYFEGQPWSVLWLYGVVALAFWIVIAAEWNAISAAWKERPSPVARLIALREQGVQILERRVQPNNESDVILYRHAVIDWDERVGQALREADVPETDISRFTTLGTFTPQDPVDPGRSDALYLTYRNRIAEKLDRLMEIAQRLEERKR